MEEKVLSVDQMREVIDMGIDTSNASLYWAINKSNPRGRKQDLMKPFLTFYTINQVVGLESFEYIPTFTIHDILDMLPNTIEWKGKTYWFSVFINSLGNKMIGYRDSELWALEWKYFNINGAFDILKWCKQNNEL